MCAATDSASEGRRGLRRRCAFGLGRRANRGRAGPTLWRFLSKQHGRPDTRWLRRRRCHNLVTTRCEFRELTRDGLRRFSLVRPIRDSLQDNRIQPLSDWVSTGRRFKSCQPDQNGSLTCLYAFPLSSHEWSARPGLSHDVDGCHRTHVRTRQLPLSAAGGAKLRAREFKRHLVVSLLSAPWRRSGRSPVFRLFGGGRTCRMRPGRACLCALRSLRW